MPARSFTSIDAAILGLDAAIETVICHPGDATGDISHVLAALRMRSTAGALVLDGSTGGRSTGNSGQRAVANIIVDNFGVDTSRVAYVDLQGRAFPSGGNLTIVPPSGPARSVKIQTVTSSTDIFKKDFKRGDVAKNFRMLKARFRGEELVISDLNDLSDIDQICYQFFERAEVDFTKDTILLWGRESGRKEGGAHPTQDHSYTLMSQIVDRATAEGKQVIVVGDYREADSTARTNIRNKAIVIGAFWSQNDAFRNRFNQNRLFYVLGRALASNGKNLVHAGMRSGALDMFAFAGQKVIYIIGQVSDDRLDKLVNLEPFAGGDRFQKFEASRNPKRFDADGKRDKTRPKGLENAEADELYTKIKTGLASA